MWKWLTNARHLPRTDYHDAWSHPEIGHMDLRQLADLPFPRPFDQPAEDHSVTDDASDQRPAADRS